MKSKYEYIVASISGFYTSSKLELPEQYGAIDTEDAWDLERFAEAAAGNFREEYDDANEIWTSGEMRFEIFYEGTPLGKYDVTLEWEPSYSAHKVKE